MKIIPDLACYDASQQGDKQWDWKCLCDENDVSDDVLVIDDCRILDGDAAGKFGPTIASLGYNLNVKRLGDHFLHFGMARTQHHVDLNRNREYLRTRLAHELGHAISLSREHQRDDRDQYLIFSPRHLRGYRAAKENVDNKDLEKEWPPTHTKYTERMALLSTNLQWAETLFPAAQDYILQRNLPEQEPVMQLEQST